MIVDETTVFAIEVAYNGRFAWVDEDLHYVLPRSFINRDDFGAEKVAGMSDVGGNAEAVADGETGRIVPARDPQALATAISLFPGKGSKLT